MPHRALFSLFFVSLFATTCIGQVATPPRLDPAVENEPQAAFKKLSEYIVSNPLDFETSFVAKNETLGTTRGTAHFFIQRPNFLRVEISSRNFNYLLISDGTQLTIYDQKKRKYAQVAARSSPLEALNLFTGLTSFEAQVLRFLGVVHDVAAGKTDLQLAAAGSDQIMGSECDRFNIVYSTGVSPDKWQVWLGHSDVPLPCKTVISNSDASNVQTNEYRWKPNPAISPDAFVFTAPAGSEKVDVGDLDLSPPH